MKNEILKASVRPSVQPCREFNGSMIFVREMTAAERNAWESVAFADDGKARDTYRPSLVAFTACDADGNLLFTVDDIPAIAGLPSRLVYRLFDVANKVNKVGDSVEDNAKNS